MQKTILVTGTSSGFGLKLTELLLKDGHRVIAAMRKVQEREHLFAHLLNEQRSRLTLIECDVTNTQDREAIKLAIQERFHGHLDVLVNNAGFGQFGALEEVSEKDLRYQMEVNFFAPALLTKELLPFLRLARGRVINLSSLMGFASIPLGGIYSASKFALEGLTEGLYFELDSLGVQACTVRPGAHRTGFNQNTHWGENASRVYQSSYKILQKLFDLIFDHPLLSGKSHDVPEKIVKLIKAHRMPRSVEIGKDAVLFFWMKKIFPANLFYFLMRKLNKALMQ